MTIKPLVELLDVKRKKKTLPTVSEEIHTRVRGKKNKDLSIFQIPSSLKKKTCGSDFSSWIT